MTILPNLDICSIKSYNILSMDTYRRLRNVEEIISPELRERIFKRDNLQCVICGQKKSKAEKLTVDWTAPYQYYASLWPRFQLFHKLEDSSAEKLLYTVCEKHNRYKGYDTLPLSVVSELTGVPEITIKKWSTSGYISRSKKDPAGAEGFKGYWPVEIVREIRAIRGVQEEKKRTMQEAVFLASEKLGYNLEKKVNWGAGPDKYHKLIEKEGLDKFVAQMGDKLELSEQEKKIMGKEIERKVALTFQLLKEIRNKYRFRKSE